MTTYILLRKNKESGPFSLDDLKTLEIHPDDLFWVEGQSVCWQKPGEIKELKNMVESVSENNAAKKQVKPNTQLFKKVEKPAFRTFELTEEKIPEGPETRYSNPLDEIKEIYLKNLERVQKRKQFFVYIPSPVKKAAPYAAFLLTGLLAGVFISKSKKGKNTYKTAAEKEVVARPKRPGPENFSDKPEVAALPENDHEISVGMIREEPAEKIQALVESTPAAEKKATSKKPVIAEPFPVTVTTVSKRDERAAQAKEAAAVPEPVPEVDISSLVSVATNDYEVGSFGGIRNLQLTVKNDSRYILEDVTVELRNLKPADEPLKTENLHFYNVPPHGSQTLSVPKSNRGVKVICRVVRIESKQP
ncbi:MAG: DUF4339 domain-containing protein [Bacteroidetes bacterium]|nr:DUF4339 domain-containing protein [Bacteroidota bacterium]